MTGAGYLDAASTEPLHPVARETLLAAIDEGWADPARLYRSARQARLLLDQARELVASLLGARPDEVTFTASGTQALHVGILAAAAGRARRGARIVHSAVEHSAVLRAAQTHARNAGDPEGAVSVGVGESGRVDPAEFAAALTPDTALACLQAANHEVGTIQPVAEVAAACATAGVPLLVDAAASTGRLDPPEGWSLLVASAHKWGGPAGVGVLAVRKGIRLRSPLPEDDRSGALAGGFENVPAILAAAASLRARLDERAVLDATHRELVDLVRARIPQSVPDVQVVGHAQLRLPHIVTFSCLYVDGEALLIELDRAGFAVSSGSSCTASTIRPSHVLAAMGVLTQGNVRVSLGRTTTRADVERFLEVAPGVVAAVRATAGVADL